MRDPIRAPSRLPLLALAGALLLAVLAGMASAPPAEPGAPMALGPLPAADPTVPTTGSSTDLEPTDKQREATRQLARQLERAHYLEMDLDDELSARLFDRYLDALDPARVYLTEGDVAEFLPWRTRMDEALRGGDLSVAFEMYNRWRSRQAARTEWLLERLAGELDDLPFGPENTLELDRREVPWAADEAELDAYWNRRLASLILDQQLRDRTLEEATESLVDRYEEQQRRSAQTVAQDVFRVFTNSLASSYDPHTQYLVPRAAENFEMRMSLGFEGIGALLRPDGEFARVERIIPGGPAEAQGELQANDRILGVAQGDEDMVDVVGWRLDDAVDLIRGPKGTTVRLLVRAADAPEAAAPKTISIVRDQVKLEEQAATGEVIEEEAADGTTKLGVVDLPSFYMDVEAAQAGDPDYKSTTRDVTRLLQEMKDDGVEGVLLDLRGNGGGSLIEAHELSGLLVGTAPVVQVRDTDGRVQVLRGAGEAVWDGPLVVLVDRLSASASEIVAAAVQDYGRGVIVGERTFGKGTVQAVQRSADGRLLVTIAKFYRVSGDSTQHAGVTPDLELPAVYDPTEIGESSFDFPLEWDRIAPVPANRRPQSDFRLDEMLPGLQARSDSRLEDDPDMQRLQEELALLDEVRQDSTVSLDLEMRRAEQDDYEARREAIVDRWREARGLGEDEELDEPVDAIRSEALQILADLVNAEKRAGRGVVR